MSTAHRLKLKILARDDTSPFIMSFIQDLSYLADADVRKLAALKRMAPGVILNQKQ